MRASVLLAAAFAACSAPPPEFDAAHAAVFYSGDPARLPALRRAFGALGAPAPARVKAMHGALMQTREFAEADELRRRFGGLGLEESPRVDAGALPERLSPQAYAVDEGGRTLRLENVDLEEASAIVVGHPRCGFSARAFAAIAADPKLSKLLSGAVILAPPDATLALDELAAWNLRHPGLRFRLAYAASGWKEVSEWSTPVFYRLENGRVVGRKAGWRGGQADKTALLRLFNHLSKKRKPVILQAS